MPTENDVSPGGATENACRYWKLFFKHDAYLSSLTGLYSLAHTDPPINRWAILFRPDELGRGTVLLAVSYSYFFSSASNSGGKLPHCSRPRTNMTRIV
jgi:hypothetical protein